jgi:hypothetical protein
LALGKITTLFEQNFPLLLGLHAFGHHFESQAVPRITITAAMGAAKR